MFFKNNMSFLWLMYCFLVQFVVVEAYRAAQAVWGSGYDIQASTFSVFNYQPGDLSRTITSQKYTVNFLFKYAYAQAPKAIAATTRYEADSSLLSEEYQGFYQQGNSTPTSMVITILGTSKFFELELRYIAINSDFPYHINAYSNDVQSYKGPVVIPAMTTSTYFANYTAQAQNFPFHTFTPLANGDFSNNKILLFIACWSYDGGVESTFGQYPPEVNVTTYAFNSSHYAIYIRVGTNATIRKLHFNLLMFDEQNIQKQGLHRLIYARVNFTDVTGGFMPVPKQFWNATLFGFTDFSAVSTSCYLFFKLYLGTLGDGRQGIIMQPPKPDNYPLKKPVQRYGITLFYLQSLICPQLNYYFNPYLRMCYQLVIEREGCNGFSILVPKCNYTRSNFNFLNEVVEIRSVQQRGENVYIHASYNRSIEGQKIKIKFPSRQIIIIDYDPFLPAFHYEENYCQAQDTIKLLLLSFTGISYFILFVSIFSGKIVGLQLFGVLQISYFILGSYDYLNVYLSPLSIFKIFNGYNLNMEEQVAYIPKSLRSMGLLSNFVNNCNIMLLLMFVFILVFGGAVVLSKLVNNSVLKLYSVKIFKQGLITFVMFNCFNITYSAGTHIKYAQQSDKLFVIGTLLLVVVLIVLCVCVTNLCSSSRNSVGEFKEKFKQNLVNDLFIPISLVYRTFLGLYCSMQNEYSQSTLIALGVSMAFLLYVIVNLPFNDFYQNYRTCLIHTTTTYILLAANYYRTMKMNTPIEVKVFILIPTIIEYVLIGLCIMVSFVVLAIEIYSIIKASRLSKKKVGALHENQASKHNLTVNQFTQQTEFK